MSVKDQVRKENPATPVTTEEKASTRRGSEPAGAPVAENPAFVPTFSFGGKTAGEWFLDRTGELAVVTDEDNNLALGIKKIKAFGASAGQRNFGTIANVTLETVLGTITGIQVRESTRNPGSIFIGTSSRKVSKEGQEDKYYNDIELSDATRAQVLSWIFPQLTKAK